MNSEEPISKKESEVTSTNKEGVSDNLTSETEDENDSKSETLRMNIKGEGNEENSIESIVNQGIENVFCCCDYSFTPEGMLTTGFQLVRNTYFSPSKISITEPHDMKERKPYGSSSSCRRAQNQKSQKKLLVKRASIFYMLVFTLLKFDYTVVMKRSQKTSRILQIHKILRIEKDGKKLFDCENLKLQNTGDAVKDRLENSIRLREECAEVMIGLLEKEGVNIIYKDKENKKRTRATPDRTSKITSIEVGNEKYSIDKMTEYVQSVYQRIMILQNSVSKEITLTKSALEPV